MSPWLITWYVRMAALVGSFWFAYVILDAGFDGFNRMARGLDYINISGATTLTMTILAAGAVAALWCLSDWAKGREP